MSARKGMKLFLLELFYLKLEMCMCYGKYKVFVSAICLIGYVGFKIRIPIFLEIKCILWIQVMGLEMTLLTYVRKFLKCSIVQ